MNEMYGFSPVAAQLNFEFGDNGAYEYCFLRSDANRFERDFAIEHRLHAFAISSARAASNQGVDILATIWTQIVWIIGATDLASDAMFAFSVMDVFRCDEDFEWYFASAQSRSKYQESFLISAKDWREDESVLGRRSNTWRFRFLEVEETLIGNSGTVLNRAHCCCATPRTITDVLEVLCE